MLTAEGETSQKLKGFQLGTDDYLVKPFEPLELVARVKARFKRYRIEISQMIQMSILTMDRKTYWVTVRGESLTLPLMDSKTKPTDVVNTKRLLSSGAIAGPLFIILFLIEA